MSGQEENGLEMNIKTREVESGSVSKTASSDQGINKEAGKILVEQTRQPQADLEPYCFLSSILIIKPAASSEELPRRVKWIVTVIVSIGAGAAPLGSTILMPALKYIAEDFHTSKTKVNLSIAFYSLAVAIVPLWWSSLSETYGRRPVYLLSFLLLIIFNVLSAESTSIDMFIAMRMLSGGASASVQSVGAGTIADLWAVRERGRAMGIFFLGPMCGPLIAPIIGGAVTGPLGWRSTQWGLVIYAGVLWIAMLFFLPETSGKKMPSNTRSRQQEVEKTPMFDKIRHGFASFCSILFAPLKVVPLFRFMPIFLTVYYASITFASYYFLNISIQATFSVAPYDFSAIKVGLMYAPSAIAAALAGLFGGRWMDRIMYRKATAIGRFDEQGNLQFRPQDRMGENAWIAGMMYPLALLCYGWVSQYHVFWFASCVATFVFGAGQMLVFNLTTTMLTEFVPKRTSTGVALNNLLRNTLACIAAIVAQPLMDAIGNGWMFTLVCFICLPSILVLVILQYKAGKWGEEMRMKLER